MIVVFVLRLMELICYLFSGVRVFFIYIWF